MNVPRDVTPGVEFPSCRFVHSLDACLAMRETVRFGSAYGGNFISQNVDRVASEHRLTVSRLVIIFFSLRVSPFSSFHSIVSHTCPKRWKMVNRQVNGHQYQQPVFVLVFCKTILRAPETRVHISSHSRHFTFPTPKTIETAATSKLILLTTATPLATPFL